MIQWLIDRIVAYAKRDPYQHIADYMLRWYILRERRWLPFAIRVHHILRSDAGRDLHDHPFWYISIILRGGYWEMTPVCRSDGSTWCQSKWHGAGTIVFRSSAFRHRLQLDSGKTALTLFIHGPHKAKGWGFHTRGGYVPREQYQGDA